MRTPLIGMLIAAEVFLVGLMFYAVKGGHAQWGAPPVANAAAFDAAPIAPLAAGPAPVVAIDDPDAHVTVDVSHDGLVHVQDLSHAGGFMWGAGTIPALHVARTGDGVSILRGGGPSGMFADVDEAIRVDVPAGARLAIGHSSGDDVSGVNGGVDVASQDGRIVLSQLRGDVTANDSDGRIEASDVSGGKIVLSTQDGRLILSRITSSSLDANTQDGSVRAEDLAISGSGAHAVVHTADGSVNADGTFGAGGNYEVSSEDGSVTARLAAGSNATVVASTSDGSVSIDGNSYEGDDAVARTVRVGDGSAKMRVASGDGTIHLTTNEAQ